MAKSIEQLYSEELGRAPDPEGLAYWSNILASGASLDDVRAAINNSPEAQIFDAYQSQLGRAPEDEGRAYWYDLATIQGVPIDNIIEGINTSLEGQNYDTQAITSAYRDQLARNPEQEGYQYWMSMKQADPNFGVDQLVQQIANSPEAAAAVRSSAIQSPSLEADPFSGRYATQSIYDLLPDAVNVSRINDRDAQFVTPVTQIPVVSKYDNGKWSSKQGDYTVNPDQFAAQVSTALDSGALSRSQFDNMMSSIKDVGFVEDFLKELNSPSATVNLNKNGSQWGVNGAEVDFGPIIANAYQGVDTRTGQKDILTNDNFASRMPGLMSQFSGHLQAVNPTFGRTGYFGGLKDLGEFGQSDQTKVGAGDAQYASELIRGLRESNQPNMFGNSGFKQYGYAAPIANGTLTQKPGGNMAFSPDVLATPSASADDVKNWNDYSAHKIEAIKSGSGNQALLSFEDWLAQKAAEKDAPKTPNATVLDFQNNL